MKSLLIALSILVATPSFADEDTAINTLAGMADEMNDYMEWYYIFFTDIDDEGVADYSRRCAYDDNYTSIHRYHLRNKMRKKLKMSLSRVH